MTTGIQLEGLEGLQRKIAALGRKGSTIENKALTKAGEVILNEAKSTSAFHDRTGDLRRGLTISKVKKQAGTKYVLVGIDKSDNSAIFYGKFLEWGTSKMPAKPFLSPAYEKNKDQVINILKEELRRGLELDK